MNTGRHPREERRREPLPPSLPALFSLIAPGAGHILIGMWTRGAVWLLGSYVLAATAPMSVLPLLALMAIAAADAYVCARDTR